MLNSKLLKIIYSSSAESKNLVFTHTGKTWVMPKDAVNGAMDMYQPASFMGRKVKNSLIKKHKTPFFCRGSKAVEKKIEINPEIKQQLEEILGISNFYVATYMGEQWTSQNDKAVLQIYSDDEIYAYVKVTTNPNNAKRFEKKANALRQIRESGIECVPKVIGLDLDSEVKMFAQSSDKPMGQEVKLEFNEQILDTIKDIVVKTKKDIEYKDTDFCKSVEYLKKQMDVFDKEQQSIVDEAIKKVESSDINFSFSHGDFTPWNVYYVGDEIRLFDLEYCSGSMPEYVDVFHYLTQTTLLGKRYTAQCAMREYEHQLDLISEYVENPKLTYICYLVWIISFYIKRADKNIDRIREALDVWVEMLEYLIKYL